MKARQTMITAAWAAVFSMLALHAYADREILPSHVALARSTCEEVMHLKQGIVPFDDCVQSLATTLSAQLEDRGTPGMQKANNVHQEIGPSPTYSENDQEERRTREERACFDIGLMVESADFSQCVARLDAALDNAEAVNSP